MLAPGLDEAVCDGGIVCHSLFSSILGLKRE
jgi:hypothetical protein